MTVLSQLDLVSSAGRHNRFQITVGLSFSSHLWEQVDFHSRFPAPTSRAGLVWPLSVFRPGPGLTSAAYRRRKRADRFCLALTSSIALAPPYADSTWKSARLRRCIVNVGDNGWRPFDHRPRTVRIREPVRLRRWHEDAAGSEALPAPRSLIGGFKVVTVRRSASAWPRAFRHGGPRRRRPVAVSRSFTAEEDRTRGCPSYLTDNPPPGESSGLAPKPAGPAKSRSGKLARATRHPESPGTNSARGSILRRL
jgi:hypothetical protein